MGLFNFFSQRKKAKERKMMLKNTPIEKRMWMFTYPEFIEYCIKNNDYVYSVKFAVLDRLKESKIHADNERKEFNTNIAREFNNMVAFSENRIEGGGDTEFKIKEYDIVNTKIFNGLVAIRNILNSDTKFLTAKFLANEYIHDPYKDKD